jgi:hypothetical protein
MPVELLTDEQVAAYGQFAGPLTRAQRAEQRFEPGRHLVGVETPLPPPESRKAIPCSGHRSSTGRYRCDLTSAAARAVPLDILQRYLEVAFEL